MRREPASRITRRCSGPSRRVNFLCIRGRRRAGSATDRPHVILPRSADERRSPNSRLRASGGSIAGRHNRESRERSCRSCSLPVRRGGFPASSPRDLVLRASSAMDCRDRLCRADDRSVSRSNVARMGSAADVEVNHHRRAGLARVAHSRPCTPRPSGGRITRRWSGPRRRYILLAAERRARAAAAAQRHSVIPQEPGAFVLVGRLHPSVRNLEPVEEPP